MNFKISEMIKKKKCICLFTKKTLSHAAQRKYSLSLEANNFLEAAVGAVGAVGADKPSPSSHKKFIRHSVTPKGESQQSAKGIPGIATKFIASKELGGDLTHPSLYGRGN